MGRNPKTGALEPLDFEHLIVSIPELESLNVDIDVYQFQPPIDSSDMTPQLWAQLVNIITERYALYDGFVILHGTDTMAYTASALSFMLENLTKPVILTGSQLPIGQLRTDGRENIITSIELATVRNDDGTMRIPEVCIYFSGRLLRGNRSTKINADGFNARHEGSDGIGSVFISIFVSLRDAKAGEDCGQQDVLCAGELAGVGFIFEVELRGIVMRTYGSGNAPQRPWLLRLLSEVTLRGVTVVNISQCVSGQVEMSRYDTGCHLLDAGVVSGYDSTVEAAVTKLMHLQARYDDAETIRSMMNKSLAGEITI